jgi:hypothetical protein
MPADRDRALDLLRLPDEGSRRHCDRGSHVRHCDTFEFYGYRGVGAALRQQGFIVNHKTIRRLMREHDLQPKSRRRFVTTTDSNHDGLIFHNLTKGVVPTGPNQLWVCDITYLALPSRSSMLPSFSTPGRA